MKMLIACAATALLGSIATAQTVQMPPSSAYETPTKSGWAIGMVNEACGTEYTTRAGYTGTIKKANGGVIYRVFSGNQVVAAAAADSVWGWANKECL
jgi:hypothetical protein